MEEQTIQLIKYSLLFVALVALIGFAYYHHAVQKMKKEYEAKAAAKTKLRAQKNENARHTETQAHTGAPSETPSNRASESPVIILPTGLKESDKQPPISKEPSNANAHRFIGLPDELGDTERTYYYTDISVRGWKHYDYSGVYIGDHVELEAEPENEYDVNAICVKASGRTIGYVPKNNLQKMIRDFQERGDTIMAAISNIDDEAVTMALAFFEPKEKKIAQLIQRGVSHKTFRLSGNRNEEMQQVISLSNEYDEVMIDYDYEKEKYMVSTFGDMGYLPESAESYLEHDYKAYIESINMDDKENLIVKVIIFNTGRESR